VAERPTGLLFLLIGKTRALTMNVAGVVKVWMVWGVKV
jgi:hypothetical protein